MRRLRVLTVYCIALCSSLVVHAAKTPTLLPTSVPILMYHYIEEPKTEKKRSSKDLSVGPTELEKQLQELQADGYKTVSFRELATGAALPAKPVILTFDDGYADAYTAALPILQKYRFTATLYIITGKVGLPGFLTWDQLKNLQDAGMELAPHTVSHEDLRRLDAKKQRDEIEGSIKALRSHLNIEPSSFAYPSGRYNKTTLGILQSLSIPFAVTTHRGVAGPKSKPLQLPRLRIKNATDSTRLLEGKPRKGKTIDRKRRQK